jgi:DNA-binding transcriptional MerR regulator
VEQEKWLTIMDYAMKNDVSLSTIRRYIKSNKVTYRMEHGRYLLLDEAPRDAVRHAAMGPSSLTIHSVSQVEERLAQLEQRMNEAMEQIAELKMLVALYEDKFQDH